MPLYDKNILLYCGVDNKSNFKIVTDNNVPKNLTGLTPYFNITDIENRQDKIQVGLTTFSALSIIAIFTLIIAGSIFYWLQVKRSRT